MAEVGAVGVMDGEAKALVHRHGRRVPAVDVEHPDGHAGAGEVLQPGDRQRGAEAEPGEVRVDGDRAYGLGIADTGRCVTVVNGQRIPAGKRVALKAEDTVQFGKTVLQVKVILKKRTAAQK